MDHCQLPSFYSVGDEEHLDVDVARVLTAAPLPIFLQQDGAHVVLVNYCTFNLVPLRLQKVSRPEGLWEHVGCGYQFVLGDALGVELMSGGRRVARPLSHSNETPSMTLHVQMDSKRPVCVALDDVKVAQL